MKVKNRNGFLGMLIVGIGFILGAMFFAWYQSPIILSFNSPQKFYNDGYVFTYSSEDYSDSLYSIAVYDIFDTGYGTDDQTSEIYAVLADDAYYLLEANPKDKQILAMLEKYEAYNSEEHPEDEIPPATYLIVEPEEDTYGSLSELLNELDPDYSHRSDNSLRGDVYLSKSSLTFEVVIALGGTLLLFAIGIGCIMTSLKRKKDNLASLEKLYALDESLRDNLDMLENVAEYVDKSLGVYIYKNHLILNVIFGFDVFDLSNLVWIYHHVTKHKMYFFITVSRDFALQINLFENGKFREQRVMLSNNKNAEAAIESLLTYIAENYPRVIVGFNSETQAEYRNFKSLHM